MSVVVRSGDTVLVQLAGRTPLEVVTEIETKLREVLPDCEVVILSGIEVLSVYRPDRAEET